MILNLNRANVLALGVQPVEETTMSDAPAMRELLGEDAPTNWGKWGPDDELGCLNYLDAGEVLRGVQHIRSGEVFTLQIQMGRTDGPGDPLWPGREGIKRKNELDESTWDGEGAPAFPGGLHYADDTAHIFLQGSTQYDALGHVWYDGQLWNGFDARTTVGAMQKASVLPIAEKGVVGRGVLIDMARHRGKDWLDKGETFDHTDLEAAAAAQGVEILPHDVLLIRTGWMKYWYELNDKEKFYDGFTEPGLTYSRELVEWFQQREVPNLVTDTIANEVTFEPGSGVALPLHCALMRNLGVALTEIAWLDDLADACAADGRWSFLYVAAPLKVVNGTGAPVNPVVIR
jgi:kynurenine formamidase